MRFVLSLLTCVALPVAALAEEMRAITGSLIYRERIALPPDAEILLELRDGAGALVETAQHPTDGAQVPLPFALDGPAGTDLTLRAALRLGGEIRWLSDAVEIEAGEDAVEAGALMLTGFRPMGFASTMNCGELVVELGFVGEGARLRIGGQYVDLVQEVTASGAKFVAEGDPDTWIWTKGDAATLSLHGSEFPECHAALPGASYRARGNEPGWTLEIAGGQMRYAGDYGATEIAAPLPEPEIVDGARRYAAEGADLVLTLTQALCRDTMTGMPYPATALVETGGQSLSGCGGDPMDLLAAHPWRVEDIGGGGIVDSSNVGIAFGRDGRVSGSGSCNRFMGGAELSGEGLRIGPVAATMMACPEALMEQEQRFFRLLDQVDRFDFAEDGALLLIGGDTVLATARR
ncbi:META domain-containing protein [Rhodovulum steppense]|uniref:Heat shock protein HslJ n=1 Tax=Rhodovulum steppense TaxID=540251 RepID=A0A4R1YU19_9RHOB|nr:META domain-containing protein [Rhodovulum steppense]TCM84581.1 heat shock protein HslJ [Rhodovulum steppense]